MISSIPPEILDPLWPQIGPLLQRALDHGQGDATTIQEVCHGIRSGHMALWAVHEGETITAAIVLSYTPSVRRPKVFVELLAGDGMASWIDELESLVRDYKDLLGADCIEASCRPGLAKILNGRGWKRKAIVMELI